jgi:uncharacterized protein (DUF427 family)
MKAVWKDQIIAESEKTVIVEGNHYFPANSLKNEFFEKSSTTTMCPWKGVASYYTVVVNNTKNEDAAWYYPTPKDAAAEIKDSVAFWRGVEVVE